MGSSKTFIVGVRVGHTRVPWPFARLDVGTHELCIRSWPLPCFKRHILTREDVGVIQVMTVLNATVVRIQNRENSSVLAHIVPVANVLGIIAEMRRCGYQVDEEW
jgi:hypothetical protein